MVVIFDSWEGRFQVGVVVLPVNSSDHALFHLGYLILEGCQIGFSPFLHRKRTWLFRRKCQSLVAVVAPWCGIRHDFPRLFVEGEQVVSMIN